MVRETLDELCRRSRCATHCIPADTVLGIGPGALSPTLSRIAATGAVQVAFGAAASSINEALGTHLSEAEVCRTAEALGAVAEAESSAGPPPTRRPHRPRRPASPC